MILTPELKKVLENPTFEGAMQFWDFDLLGPPIGQAPLAGIHKARLKWPDCTPEQRKESLDWLSAHGYQHTIFGK